MIGAVARNDFYSKQESNDDEVDAIKIENNIKSRVVKKYYQYKKNVQSSGKISTRLVTNFLT